MKIHIEINGKSDSDIEVALEEVSKLINEGNTSGFNKNETGSYSFKYIDEPEEITPLQDFKNKVRNRRGALTSFDSHMAVIFKYGTKELKQFTLDKKLMGIENISWIALKPIDYQNKFTSWMLTKHWKAEKNELELWFSQNN